MYHNSLIRSVTKAAIFQLVKDNNIKFCYLLLLSEYKYFVYLKSEFHRASLLFRTWSQIPRVFSWIRHWNDYYQSRSLSLFKSNKMQFNYALTTNLNINRVSSVCSYEKKISSAATSISWCKWSGTGESQTE